jgi:CheY-like chemotaxis protein
MSSKKILLVEDDKDVRICLKDLLNTLDYEVEEASHGLHALEKICHENFRPDGIILDLMMPVMDGREFLSHLRAEHPELSRIPIIVLSARENFNEIIGDVPDINAKVSKPFAITELIAILDGLYKRCGHD